MKSAAKRSPDEPREAAYPVTLVRQEDGTYFAAIPDLPGCMTEGRTPDEAMDNIEAVRVMWIKDARESGVEVPVPASERRFSGKFVVRLSQSLHRRLAHRAERDGVSLNHLVVMLLAENSSLRAVEERVGKICSATERAAGVVSNLSWQFRLGNQRSAVAKTDGNIGVGIPSGTLIAALASTPEWITR